MNLKQTLSIAALAAASILAADELRPLDFIPDQAVTESDLRETRKFVDSVLAGFPGEYAKASVFADSLKNSNPELNDALTKRLEIATRLKNYIEARKDGSSEMKILAWQGAHEMAQLLEYFRAEEKNLAQNASLPAPVEMSVRDYGAKGDGVSDDGPAFRKAIAAAAEHKGAPVTLRVPAGKYRIKSSPECNPQKMKIRSQSRAFYNGATVSYPKLITGHLLIANMDNFTLAGEKGTTFLFDDPTAEGIWVVGCRNLTVRDFSIDYAEYPFTQGAIVKVEDNPFALIFKPDPGYPAPDEKRFLEAEARRFTPHLPNGLWGLGTTRLGSIEKTSDGLFRLIPQQHDAKSSVWVDRKAGDVITIIQRISGATALELRDCGFCKIRNIIIHKAPGCAFRAFKNYGLIMTGCRIEPTPGSRDLMTTNADGCQTTGPIGPYVANCYFSGMEDDGFNIHSSSPELADIPAPNRTSPFASVGGFLISGVDGTVKAVLRPLPKGHPGYFQPLPENAVSRKMCRKDMSNKEKEAADYFGGRAYLYRNRPDRINMIPGDLTGTVIVNSEFFNIRGMALQLTAPNILIENCKIKHMNSFGINISALLPWGMTFNPHNVVIRNCKLEDTENPTFSLRYRALEQNGICKPRFINGILIENCDIDMKTWCAVEVHNASDIKIRNCRFRQIRESVNNDPHTGVVVCENFGDLMLENNYFDIMSPEKYLPVNVVQSSEKGQVREKDSVVKKRE